MAAALAEKCQAKCLLLNHFSQRYKPRGAILEKKEGEDGEEEEENVTVELLLEQAKQSTSRPVFVTDDFFTYTIPLPK